MSAATGNDLGGRGVQDWRACEDANEEQISIQYYKLMKPDASQTFGYIRTSCVACLTSSNMFLLL